MQNNIEKTIIIFFTRYPEAGKTKTRLIPALGAEKAAKIHQEMAEYILKELLATNKEVHIYYTGATLDKMKAWLGSQHTYFLQSEGDLGQRIYTAFAQSFALKAQKVLVVGADCPNNRHDNIEKAITLLNTAPCVIGPTHDGGYYLIGLKDFVKKDLFENINWGTSQVLEQSKIKLQQYSLLPTLHDVDFVQDIPPKISVIIPSLNEEDNLAKAISTINKGFRVEIILADGGSKDNSCAIAEKLGAKIVKCNNEHRGRAKQMNYGALQANGDILLFLHADSQLPTHWDREIRQCLENHSDRNILGYFNFAVDNDFWGSKLLTYCTNFRAKRYPYGDQGFFMRKKDFSNMGGFMPVPILEDVYFVKKWKKNGILHCINLPLTTSSRRWKKHGFLKVTIFNQAVLLAAKLGFNLDKIANAYRKGSIFALWK